jgi:hypothetical protein
MSQHQSPVAVCMWTRCTIVKVLIVPPEHIGGPLLPVLLCYVNGMFRVGVDYSVAVCLV